MSDFEYSPQQLRNAATNATVIGNAIAAHPVHALPGGDIGHPGVAAAIDLFRSAWSNELRLRNESATEASLVLAAAARDTERVDALLADAASRLGAGR